MIGPELGVTQPGHDDRLRRLAHLDARRVRRARVRHRHERGRARPRHAGARSSRSPKSMRIIYEGELGFGVTAKDLILGTIGQIGTSGGVGHVDRVRRPGDRGALDGGPDDGLQHDDRGRRPRGHGRARRHDLRVGRGPRRRAGAPTPSRRVARAAAPTRARRFDTRGRGRRLRALAAGDLGHHPGHGRAGHRRGPRAAQRGRRARARPTWT